MPSERHFVVCLHDASPAWADETRRILRGLAPLVGRRLSVGVVPDWHGHWPLAEHPGFCRLVEEGAEEILLHGYFHRRGRGRGPVSWLTGGSDEMNGLDPDETRRTLEQGQQVLTAAFGAPAHGFLAPAWQPGHARPGHAGGLEHMVTYLSLQGGESRRIPLATWSWDCGRWGWLGHVGHGLGCLLGKAGGRVPTLAIHPLDLQRGFWPRIRGLVGALLRGGREPSTMAGLLEEG